MGNNRNNSDEKFGIGELAARMSVTPRTIRYYVSEGLLPPPEGAGQHRLYNQEHELRLEAIKRLKDAYMPLSEIRSRLDTLSRDEIREVAERPTTPSGASALEYVTNLLAQSSPPQGRATPAVREASRSYPGSADPSGEVWRRVELAPGVELSYRPSNDPDSQIAIDRLVRVAEGIFASGQRLPPNQPREE